MVWPRNDGIVGQFEVEAGRSGMGRFTKNAAAPHAKLSTPEPINARV